MPMYEIEIKREMTVHGDFEIEAQTPEEAFALMEKILERQYGLTETYDTIDTFKWKDHYVDDSISVSIVRSVSGETNITTFPDTHNENAAT